MENRRPALDRFKPAIVAGLLGLASVIAVGTYELSQTDISLRITPQEGSHAAAFATAVADLGIFPLATETPAPTLTPTYTATPSPTLAPRPTETPKPTATLTVDKEIHLVEEIDTSGRGKTYKLGADTFIILEGEQLEVDDLNFPGGYNGRQVVFLSPGGTYQVHKGCKDATIYIYHTDRPFDWGQFLQVVEWQTAPRPDIEQRVGIMAPGDAEAEGGRFHTMFIRPAGKLN